MTQEEQMPEKRDRPRSPSKGGGARKSSRRKRDERAEPRPRTAPEVTMSAGEIEALRDRLQRKFH